MIRINRWRPDTCECVIEYQWDDTVDEDNRTHAVSSIIQACEFHSSAKNQAAHFAEVVTENQKKNQVYGVIMEGSTTATKDELNKDGSTTKVFKEGKEFAWSFDEERNLVVELKGFTAQEKTEAATLLEDFEKTSIKD